MKPIFKILIIFGIVFQSLIVFAKDYSKFNLNEYQKKKAWYDIHLISKEDNEIKKNFKQIKRKLNVLTHTEDQEKIELYFLEIEKLALRNYNLIPDKLKNEPRLLNHYRRGMKKLLDTINKTIQLYRNGNYNTTEIIIKKMKALQEKYHEDLSITD